MKIIKLTIVHSQYIDPEVNVWRGIAKSDIYINPATIVSFQPHTFGENGWEGSMITIALGPTVHTYRVLQTCQQISSLFETATWR
jgi:hypothetical protein